MRDLRGRFAVKAAALVLATVLAAGAVLCYAATIAVWNGIGTAPSYYEDALCWDVMDDAMYNALYLVTEPDSSSQAEYTYRQEILYAGFAYKVYYGDQETGILMGSGGIREDTVVGKESTLTVETSAAPPSDVTGNSETSQGELTVTAAEDPAGYYTVVGWVYQGLPSYGNFYLTRLLYNLIHSISGISAFLCILMGLGSALCLIFLVSAAGHRSGAGGIVPNWQDRIPLELYFGGDALLLYITLVMMDGIIISSPSSAYMGEILSRLGGLCLCVLLGWLICLAALMTIATRLKLGKWWRNSLCYLLLRFLLSCFRKIWRIFGNFLQILPVAWRAVVLVGGILIAQTFLTLLMFESYNSGPFFLLALTMDLAIVIGTAWLCRQLQQIRDMGASLAAGNLEAKIDTRKMFRDIRSHAENLNAIGTGMTRAVEQRMKSERLKTELITNVSHDIKTPLTSIINYVDLLKRENPEDPKIRGYLEVLENKAQRLKVLTEDVVEASKASTGNIALEMTDLNFIELVHQVIGEFEEKFEERNLTMVVHFDEEEAIICADGRRLWRVLENVFGNVSKYAMENTRVYVDVKVDRPNVQLSLKNISAQPLNISADELTERFIRGDVSRNTEGSGLGLSIAKDLVQLQGGEFRLYLDGDLFKVTIEFKMK